MKIFFPSRGRKVGQALSPANPDPKPSRDRKGAAVVKANL